MATNPYVNKVVYGNETLIDLSDDTVTSSSLLSGYTAHDRSGASITGTAATDIQIAGTSIISNGVANIPYATTTSPGVVMTSGQIQLGNDHKLWINNASDNGIKEGTSTTSYLTPSRQEKAVFYGLTKAAGVDMASSNNAIGTYTDAAKIAIQKMIGVYPQWELIRTLTTEQDLTQVTINTDDYGNAFKLSKMMIIIECGTSTTGNRDSFYCQAVGENNSTGTSHTFSTPSLQYVTATSNMFARVEININYGAPITIFSTVAVADGNTQRVDSMVKNLILDSIKSFKVYQSASDKTLIPSGSTFYVYGIRI